MGGVAEKRDRSLRPAQDRLAVVERPFQPSLGRADQRKRLRRPIARGKSRQQIGTRSRLAPAGRVPVVVHDDDDVDEAAALDRVVHEMGVAAEPEMDQRLGEFRRPHRSPERARARRCAPAKRGGSPWPRRRASRRPQPVGGNECDAALLGDAGAAARRDGDAVLMHDEIFHVRAELQRDAEILRHRAGERRLQIAAMDRPIGRAVTLGGRFAERHADDFAAALGVEDAQCRRRDHVRLAAVPPGRDRSMCARHWARAGCRRRFPQAARLVRARRRGSRCAPAPMPRSARRCRRLRQ